MNKTLYKLRSYLEHVKIGPPIWALFRPDLAVDLYSEDELAFCVTLHSVDAEGKVQGDFRVKKIDMISLKLAQEFVERPEDFIAFVWANVENIVLHELMESFTVNGQYYRHPHPNQPGAVKVLWKGELL